MENNAKADNILSSGKDITQWSELPYVNPLDLLGYTFVWNHENNYNRAELKYLLKERVKVMAEVINGMGDMIN